MAQAKVITGATGTSSTTDITSSGFGTPDGAILFISGVTSANADTSDDSWAIVLWDGSTTVCEAGSNDDNVADSVVYGGLHSDVRLYTNGSSSADCIGTLSSITDGLRISWSNTPGSSWRYTAVLFGGGVSLKAGTIAQASSDGGTAQYTGASFQPQAGLFVSRQETSYPAGSSTAIFCLGAFTYKSSTIVQRAACYGLANGQMFQFINAAARNNAVSTNTSTNYLELTAVASNGFTVTTRSDVNAKYHGFLLIGGLADCYLGDTPIPSSTGSKSWEGPGFQPGFLMMVQTGMNSYTTATNEDWCVAVGVSDGTTSGGFAGWADDEAATMDNGHRANTTNFLQSYQTTYADQFGASFTSFDSLGWDMNYGEVGGSAADDIGFSLALQFSSAVSVALSGSSASASAGTLSLSHTQSLTGSAPSTLAGALSLSHAQTLSGQAGTASAGTVALSHTQALAGSAPSALAGALGLARDSALSGDQLSVTTGSLVAALGAALAGAEASTASGSLSIAVGVPLTGSVASALAGTLTPEIAGDVTVALSGEAVSALAGVLSPVLAAGLSGQQVLAYSGALSSANALALTGQAASVAEGTLGMDRLASLAGDAVAALDGAVSIYREMALVGHQASSAGGAISVDLGVLLAGGVAESASGAVVTSASGDKSLFLTGEYVVTHAGTLTPEHGGVPSQGGYYSPGLGGELFPKRKEPRRPRVRVPEPRRAEPKPISDVLVAAQPPVVRPVLLAPDAAEAVVLVLEGGMWREPATERLVYVEGMWREITKRTSWQYEINGKWVNYE